jgi:hypothetical protein
MEKTIEIGRTFVLPAQSADIPGRVAEQLWPPANMPLWIFVQFLTSLMLSFTFRNISNR